MDIRRIDKTEYSKASMFALHVFTTCNRDDYNDEGLDTFKSFIFDKERMNELTLWGAFHADRLIGILGVRETERHISLFFIHPDYQRQKIGSRLFYHAVNHLKQYPASVHASTSAVGFYEHLGFVKVAGIQTTRGLTYVPMVHLP